MKILVEGGWHCSSVGEGMMVLNEVYSTVYVDGEELDFDDDEERYYEVSTVEEDGDEVYLKS